MGEKSYEKPGSLPITSGLIISMSQGICALVANDARERIRSAVAVIFRGIIVRLIG
jgi:AmiR/NasT family two-component response regulator